MSAETLRRAAALMRERAEATGAAPWFASEEPATLPGNEARTYVRHSVWGTDSWGKGNTPYIAAANGRTGAEHIASWHPAVALAVADWLDHESVACGLNRAPFVDETHDLAHAVARAYLGGDA